MNKLAKINTKLILIVLVGSIILASDINYSEFDLESKEGIPYLYRKGEINENFSDNADGYFMYIDDFCCDDENNLYIADSGWNKIFKFDSEGKYVTSFGREGQGPGEFLAVPKRYALKITFGNDKNIYITDAGNKKILVFSKEGKLLKQFSLPFLPSDSAHANSKGDIYLISKSGVKAVDCYDKNFMLKSSFLNIKKHFEFPFYDPPWKGQKLINDTELKKIITKEDHIIIISNNSLKAFHFNESHNLINSFLVRNENFLKDFKVSLKRAIEKRGFIFPFFGCLDNEQNLCIFYYNRAIQNWEMYRYKLDGEFLDIFRFSDKNRPLFCIDRLGNIFTALNESVIGIYRIYKEGGK